MSNVDLTRYSKRLVQLFYDPQPKNDNINAAPIWCLGRKYDPRKHAALSRPGSPTASTPSKFASSPAPSTPIKPYEPEAAETPFEEVHLEDARSAGYINASTLEQTEEASDWPKHFLDDFESRPWLTYRSAFPPIEKSQDPKATSSMSLAVRLKSQLAPQGFTSDTGWGCMIRSGQCVLANALFLAHLGRDWRRGIHREEEKKLLSLFADDPHAPFSIHNFVAHGAAACGTYPGQWFGPSATAQCIEALTARHPTAGLRVYVTGDGPNIYASKLMRIARPNPNGPFSPTLLLIGTRLGIERITPAYRSALAAALQLPQSVGIAGGRPSASHYFVGVQDDAFFYLDPHHTRAALPWHDRSEDYSAEEVDSCHTRRLRRISVEEMDPSMLIAFLIKDEDDWRAWRAAIEGGSGKAIVHVADEEPAQHGAGSGSGYERAEALDEVTTIDDEEDEFEDET